MLGARRDLLAAQLRERLALLDRVADQAADDPVRLAEGHAAADQQVGDLGRRQHLVAGGGLQPLAVELDPGQHPLGRVEADSIVSIASKSGSLSSCMSLP